MEDEGKIDIRVVTPNTIPSIAAITGRSEESLRSDYDNAVKQNSGFFIFLNYVDLPNGERVLNSWRKGECYYQKRGSYMVCLIHNQASKHLVSEGAHHPCAAVDPW